MFAPLATVLLVTQFITVPMFALAQEKTSNPPTSRVDQKQGGAKPTVRYENTQYGFSFSLPAGWKGYTIVADNWGGNIFNNGIAEQGPIISIRHPKWTEEKPRQDIPIMVFTLAQWKSLEDGDFSVGAAPFGPGELGRNRKYVFALPARYNYSDLEGQDEVENILRRRPLHAWDKIGRLGQREK